MSVPLPKPGSMPSSLSLNPHIYERKSRLVDKTNYVYYDNIQMSMQLTLNLFKEILGFDWDQSNLNKNLVKHGVAWQEAEAAFRNQPIVILEDLKHSSVENRYTLYGRTDNNRKLTIIFTIRASLFRVISARDQSRLERRLYDQAKS